MVKKKANEEAFRKSLHTSFRDNLEQSKLKLALLKENFEYQDFFDNFLEWDKKTKNKVGRVWPAGGFDRFGLTGIRFYISHPSYGTVIDLINPQKDSNTIPEKFIDAILPRLFYESAVELIELEGTNRLLDGGTIRTIWSVYERGLKPYERIYKVDLSKKKTQIMKEFKGYLDRAYLRNEEESNWAPYKKRNRDEAWDHLKVWILRKKRKSFSEIAQALNITTEATKKSFYRAYELIYWEKYDPVLFKRDYWEIRQRDIARQCKSCHSHPNNGGDCTELCPDVLPYVDQDEIKQRELLVEQRAVNILDKKSKTKTVIKKKAISLNKATACPKCNTTFQEALESLGSKLCPFCHKKIST